MSNTQTVQITTRGIQNSLKKYNHFEAIAEYIWNGFDAGADTVEVCLDIGPLSSITGISIKDNGLGINRNQLDTKFKPFFQSEKLYDPKDRHSEIHGKNGVGRLTFFTFCSAARWNTTYIEGNVHYSYTIDIDSHSLEEYVASQEKTENSNPGTTVSFFGVDCTYFSVDTITSFLVNEFCWYLELRKKDNYKILINGVILDYSSNIKMTESVQLEYPNSKLPFDINIVIWQHKLSDYSKYYYMNADGKEIGKENTTLNNKGDKFYHSVYIQSPLFNSFDLNPKVNVNQGAMFDFRHRKSPEYLFVISEVNKLLREIRRPFLQNSAKDVVKALDVISAFPHFDKNNLLDLFKQQEIESMATAIYCAEPKVFSNLNKEQKNTFVRLLDLTIQSGEVDTLFNILQEIIDMDTTERDDLSDILKLSRMSNVTRTIKLIHDRYNAIDELRALVFNKELNANEVNHLQKFIEKHYWIFGEQYNLVTAAEPSFEQALKRYLHYLHEEYKNVDIIHADKYKQMDIFAVRQDLVNDRIENIVVELKHPDVPLGEPQLSQVKKYMGVVLSTPEFNAPNMFWKFYLVGNRLNTNGFMENELANNKHHGESSLVFNVKNHKIYVKTWSELFTEFELRHKHLNDKLKIEREKIGAEGLTVEQIIDKQDESTAIQPHEMAGL